MVVRLAATVLYMSPTFHRIFKTAYSKYASSLKETNRPFPSCREPHCESEAKCKVFHMKIGFVCI